MENDINKHPVQLQDFVRILADRTELYTGIISSIHNDSDIHLIAFVEKCMQLSQQFKSEILAVLPKEDALPPEKGNITVGLYADWQAKKSTIATLQQEEPLEALEKLEATILHILRTLLSAENDFTENTTAIIKSQTELQQEIYEQLISLRNGDAEA